MAKKKAKSAQPALTQEFAGLTPDVVIELVEEALGERCSNLCRSLNSYINRVYEIELDHGGWVIAKFYRPGRWSQNALQDEQDYLSELADAELSVVAPLRGKSGATLHKSGTLSYALFPKRGGRPLDEPNDQQWMELGRLLGRVHEVGARHGCRDRAMLSPAISTAAHLDYILESGQMSAHITRRYEEVVRQIIKDTQHAFDNLETIRIHGDCHAANIIQRPGEPLFLIDFDDMVMGPAVQDFWMLLPDYSSRSRRELDLILGGYEMFREFERSSLRLIEPLRAMRFIHYTAWCARQRSDGGFSRLAPDWGSEAHWQQEIRDLETQQKEISEALSPGSGIETAHEHE